MTYLSSIAPNRKEACSTSEGEIPLRKGGEFSLTLKPAPGEDLPKLFRRLDHSLRESGATILKLMIYGPVKMAAPATAEMQRVFGKINWPVTWVEGLPCDCAPIAGIQASLFNGGTVSRLTLGGRVIGSVFEDGDARYCQLGGLVPDRTTGTRSDQTERILEQMQSALAQAGFALGDVIRTWFFLDDLLAWYGAFNEVRTRVYSQAKFRANALPASTGVAGRNSTGVALTADAMAMRPLNSLTRAVAVPSPLQCPAFEYGSSFSRALEISSAASRRLYVSGTASIAPDGRTLHAGDLRAQIGLSMQVVEAILESRGMSFANAMRATAYFKNPEDVRFFADWCEQRELRSLPVICTGCDICRPELLFEIEMDAVAFAAGG
jgi:enamine deaminase RidA (YjgF/YER057c/UK114 family)